MAGARDEPDDDEGDDDETYLDAETVVGSDNEDDDHLPMTAMRRGLVVTPLTLVTRQ